MTQDKSTRLFKAAKEFNVGVQTIVDFLHKKGVQVDANPNAKINTETYLLLEKEFGKEFKLKEEASKVDLKSMREKKASISIDDVNKTRDNSDEEEEGEEDSSHNIIVKDNTSTERRRTVEAEVENVDVPKIKGPNIVGKINLDDMRAKRPAADATPSKPEDNEQPAEEVKKNNSTS